MRKVTKSDVVWNYIGTFMSLGGNFLVLPFVMYYLDSEILGLWYVFLSIGGIVTLFDFGFTPTFARNVAYCWSGAKSLSKTDVIYVDLCEPNIALLKKVIYTCKRIYLVISLIALSILLTIGLAYICNVSKNISGYAHIIAWLIYSFAIFSNLYYGYYTTFLRGVGAIAQVNKATVISRIFQIVLSIILLFLGFGIIGVSIAYLLYGFLFRFVSKILFYRYENIGDRIKTDPTSIQLNDIKETFILVWHNAWRDGLVSLSNYLSNQATVLISSMYFSLTDTGMYSISIQLITAIATISGALYGTFQPSLQASYINRDFDGSKKMMSLAMTVYCILFWIGVAVLIVIGIPMLRLIKTDIVFNIPLLIAIAVYEFLFKHHSYYASYISNTNNVPYVKPYILSSLLAIAFATLLASYTSIGVWSLIYAQAIVQGAYNNWVWPYKVMKTLKTNPVQMFKIGLGEIDEILSHTLHMKKSKNRLSKVK